ncbi:MAG: hypothetical protein J07HX64_02806 [halophilic archaeon J07HX64]|nr:MAG: hypothetical protein J07HX64_02806 [halophilic archaeon J07HX64]
MTNDRTVAADRALLEQLFECLFQNVDDRCPAGVTVTVRGTEGRFSVADDGPDLLPGTADSLFGDEVDDRRIQFSLLMIERIASGHGWELCRRRGGTRFVFSGVGDVDQFPLNKLVGQTASIALHAGPRAVLYHPAPQVQKAKFDRRRSSLQWETRRTVT